MNEELRQRVIETLRKGEELPREWAQELFPPEKREYELVYFDKKREEDIRSEVMAVPLQPVRTYGTDNDYWTNKLILGDNLQVMKTLLRMKDEGLLVNPDGVPGIKLIYIDPPFATKQDFKGSKSEKAYRDKVIGAQFLEFLRRRLVMIHELLASNGSLFVHLDQRKAHYVKVLLDEIFGEHNFRNEIILPGRAAKNLQRQFATVSRLNVRHDTLFWYTRTSSTRFSHLWVDKHGKGNPNGHWHHFWSTADRKTMRYELFGITPDTGQWTWKEERALEAVANYERFLEESGGRSLVEYWRDTGRKLRFIRQNPEDGSPQYWRAPSEVRLADTMWAGVPLYSNSTKYPTEKNESFLEQVIELGSDPDDIVLDAFAGSGTTLAVAEKMKRRWIGIDRGKLSIYTIQKRMLTLTEEVGNNKAAQLEPSAFTFFNAGLYDFSSLQQLPWVDWRFFALQLFECRDQPHSIGGLKFDGKRKGSSVLVFNHYEHSGQRIDEETIHDIHIRIGDKAGSRLFIIAPRNFFAFQQDYIQFEDVRYYALRIPYSFIHELHRREFTALRQPTDETTINELVDSEGFDFIEPPKVDWIVNLGHPEGQLFDALIFTIKNFSSSERLLVKADSNIHTFSMVLIDVDYDDNLFRLDKHFYADEVRKQEYSFFVPVEEIGQKIMIIFIDIYGNETIEVMTRESLGLAPLTLKENDYVQ